MTRAASGLVRVWCVVWCVDDDDDGRYAGPAGDGSHVTRFRSEREAMAFAAGRECYGRPAKVDVDDVPRALARRWWMA